VKKRFHQRIRPIIPTVLSRLHVAPFEIGEFEVKVRAYLDGHFFRIHMDCPPKEVQIAHRRVSYVYFFHKQPRAYTGGDLLLFDSDPVVDKTQYTTAGFTRIVPDNNSIIIFPSAYWHSVIPVSCPSKEFVDSRFVINGHVSKRVTKSSAEALDGNGASPTASSISTATSDAFASAGSPAADTAGSPDV
jgi:Rps23 Pro-64 3,4-dihydroxylase Tpa1-like proline 4-hydroxylase